MNLISLVVCFVVIVSIPGRNGHLTDFLQKSFNILKTQNDISFDSMIFVSTDDHCTMTEIIVCEEIKRVMLFEKIAHSVLFITIHSNNDIIRFEKALYSSMSSLIVLFGFETSKELQDTFANMSYPHLVKNSWLILLPYDTNQQQLQANFINKTAFQYQDNIRLNSQVYALIGNYRPAKLVEIYRYCIDRPIKVNLLADFSNATNAALVENFIWNRRKDLHQCPLRVAYLTTGLLREINMTNQSVEDAVKLRDKAYHFSPKHLLDADGKTLYGPPAQLFRMLYNRLNFSIQWVYVVDDKFGSADPKTGAWNGIVGYLSNNKADTSILELSVTQERGKVIRFSAPFVNFKHQLFVKKPGPSSSWSTFVDVFNPYYWFALVSVLSTCSLFLILLFTYFDTRIKLSGTCFKETLRRNIFSGVATTSLAFGVLDMGHARSVSHTSASSIRLMSLIICFSGALNYYVYNAGLISYLMVYKYEPPINDLSDILNRKEYKLVLSGGTATEEFLKHSNEKQYQRIWEKTAKENGILSSDREAEKAIRNDNLKVFFGESPTFQMTFSSFPCEVMAIKRSYNPHEGAYGFHNDSPYVELFSHHIRRLQEAGLNTEGIRAKQDVECEAKKEEIFRAFNYQNVFSVFVFSGIGCTIALLYCIMERVYERYLEQYKKKLRTKTKSATKYNLYRDLVWIQRNVWMKY